MSITSISPIDGRYASKTSALTEIASEKALIQYRILVECCYLMLLSEEGKAGIRKFSEEEIKTLSNLHILTDEEAGIVKQIETKGYKDIPGTNHDVKAIEYYIKLKLQDTSLADVLEIVHFALTSEDINNIAYSLIIKDGINHVLIQNQMDIYDQLYQLAVEQKNSPMLARTHGQPASPTTFGKEILIFVNRLKDEIAQLSTIPVLIKLNGATGNYNAHAVTFPDIDWQDFSKKLSAKIDAVNPAPVAAHCSRSPIVFKHNRITPQIEPHDSYARVFDSLKRINTILIDFCQDTWRYISDNWIKQKVVKGEIGSSAMPHKVNPIDFENAEGNLGVANALLIYFGSKLSISRLQRDLSDSTVLRNIGTAYGHSLIAYKSILKGLSKIEVDKAKLLEAVQNTPEVMAEAYQNILRIEGVEKPYELLKSITRGKKVTSDHFYQLANSLDVDDAVKQKLLAVKPENYIGIAPKIVEEFEPGVF